MFGATLNEKAYVGPFLAFLAVMLFGEIVASLLPHGTWMVDDPRYWVLPAQTVVGGVLLARYSRCYALRWPVGAWFAILIGVVALIIWIAPQEWLGVEARRVGFEPHFFGADGWPYWANLTMRFVRLVIIVPLLEEIFWRGFMLRYFIDDDFTSVPMGTFTWKSFGITVGGFCLEHGFADWPAAILTGALFNLVAYRTRSLSACVLTHAVTNLLLGLWVLRTGQWGFW